MVTMNIINLVAQKCEIIGVEECILNQNKICLSRLNGVVKHS